MRNAASIATPFLISWAHVSDGLIHARTFRPPAIQPTSLHSATAASNHCRHLEDAVAGAQMLAGLRSSVFGDPFGRPSFFPCWRTRFRPAMTLLQIISRSGSPKTDAIWIIALTHRRRAVDRLLVGIEGDVGSIEFGQGIRHVENAAPQPGHGPHHQNIEPSPYHVFVHRGVCGALIPAFRAASCASQPTYRSARGTETRGTRVRCGPATVQRMALSGPVSEKSPFIQGILLT